jgi:hypothetical protein
MAATPIEIDLARLPQVEKARVEVERVLLERDLEVVREIGRDRLADAGRRVEANPAVVGTFAV